MGTQVKDCDGNIVVAISVGGPSARLTDNRLREIIPLIKICGLAISRVLGYRGE